MILTNFQKRFFTSIVLLSLIFLIFKFKLILVYFLIILGIFSILEFMDVTKRLSINLFLLYFINFIFIFYVFIFCLNFFLFSNLPGLKIILLILLLACVASDIGGFIFGKIFKGPKVNKNKSKQNLFWCTWIYNTFFNNCFIFNLLFRSNN